MHTSMGELATLPRPSALGRDEWTDLLGVASDALNIFPPIYVSSVLGLPWTWLPPHHRYSEFRILDIWQLQRAISYVADVTLPSMARSAPPFGPPFLNDLIWRPTVVIQRPDHYGSYTSYPREAWIFINGILTNDGVAYLNAAYLADLFHRPITVVQNSTGGILADLAECALGKQWYRATESVNKAFPVLYDALKSEKEKVVLIAHSQGTIIAAVLLRLLEASLRMGERAGAADARDVSPPLPDWPIDLTEFEPITRDDLAKLEIYAIANCASEMKYVEPGAEGRPPLPLIESYGNEYDIVARLGMLAPRPEQWGIRIDGPRYVRRDGWGHLLNDHYLQVIDTGQRAGHRRGGRGDAAPYELLNPEAPHDAAPRLFSYINGGAPRRPDTRNG